MSHTAPCEDVRRARRRLLARQPHLLRTDRDGDRLPGRERRARVTHEERFLGEPRLDLPAAILAGRDLPLDDVDVADELGDEARPRPLVELARRGDLDEPAAIHHRDAVGHGHRLLLVVRDDEEGGAEPDLDVHELELGLLAQLPVERRERLVEEQHLRLLRQRAGERDPLALSAGELVRPAVGKALELHELQHLGDARLDRRRRGMPSCLRPKAMFFATLICGKSA